MNLQEIQPLGGIRDWLLAEWIEQQDINHVQAFNSPDPYHDDTYDLYGGIAAYVQPETILEIGVFRGYSMAAMLKGADGSVSVALGVDKGVDVAHASREAVKKLRFEFPSVGIAFLEIDSQTDYQKVPRGPYDIVHIDGDHSYEGATNDLANYGKLVSERGVIIVHDTVDPNVHQAALEFAYRQKMDYRQIDNACGNILLCRRQP